MKIAIEGMDGVGKTTIAKAIEKDLHYIYIKDPLKELFEIDDSHLIKISDKIFNSNNDKLISWYLALGDSYVLSKYKDKNIVMDRHILLNYFWNGNEQTEDIFKTQIDMFGKPDLTIILYASPEVRMKRISERNPNDPDLQKPNMKQYGYDKMEAFMKKYDYNYVIVDTENKTIDDVIYSCKKVINENR